MVSYLSDKDAPIFRARMQSAYKEPTYESAKSRLMEIKNDLMKIKNDLMKINRTAANSLQEGLWQSHSYGRGNINTTQIGFISRIGKIIINYPLY